MTHVERSTLRFNIYDKERGKEKNSLLYINKTNNEIRIKNVSFAFQWISIKLYKFLRNRFYMRTLKIVCA